MRKTGQRRDQELEEKAKKPFSFCFLGNGKK